MEDENTERFLTEIRSLSENAHKLLAPAMTDYEKREVLLMASYEKMLMELISQNYELKVIQNSLYYYWFFLEAPLHGAHPSWVEGENPWAHMKAILDIIIGTVNNLPDPDFPDEILALNAKMQQLKACLPSPEEVDKVPEDKVIEQSKEVDPIIHSLTCDFLKQRIPIDEITQVIFYHLLRCCTLSGFSEYEWQKMNYYISTIITNVRVYFRKAAARYNH